MYIYISDDQLSEGRNQDKVTHQGEYEREKRGGLATMRRGGIRRVSILAAKCDSLLKLDIGLDLL